MHEKEGTLRYITIMKFNLSYILFFLFFLFSMYECIYVFLTFLLINYFFIFLRKVLFGSNYGDT